MPAPITTQEKERVAYQVFSLFAKYGFDEISMDEVARRVKMSKATLYKYFKSKEDIVRDLVSEITGHLESLKFSTDQGIDGILESITAIYYKSVIIAAYSSSKFMNDLKEKYPDIFAGYIMTLEATQKRFAAFYEQAVLGGYCKSLPIGLVGEQIRTMLPVIIRGDYLSRRKTTLPEVIADYYQLLLYQLLSKEYMDTAERDHICSFVDDVVKILKNQFLLD